jgi:hypothetical protein
MITTKGKAVHIKVTFCMNDKCLPSWLDTPKRNHDIQLKPFNQLLWIQPTDQIAAQQALPNWTLELIPPLKKL